jgi:hypothetical protein
MKLRLGNKLDTWVFYKWLIEHVKLSPPDCALNHGRRAKIVL